MSDQTNFRESQNSAHVAHDWLDARAPLSILQNCFGYSLREIDALSVRYTGLRASPATLSKLANRQPDAPRTLPGVSQVAIRVMASTGTGIARRVLLREFGLRAAAAAYYRHQGAAEKDDLERQLLLAQSDIASERTLITKLSPPGQDCAERALDLAAVDYLEGQMQIHAARLLLPHDRTGKLRRFGEGLQLMTTVCERLDDALRAGARVAETVDLILAVNAHLNAYFIAYEIDLLVERQALDSARSVADKIASPLFLLAADACAVFQNDPRVAFNAGSGAGFAGQHAAAAKRLALAAQLDGFQGKDIRDWSAAWMLEPLTASVELAGAIEILSRNAR